MKLSFLVGLVPILLLEMEPPMLIFLTLLLRDLIKRQEKTVQSAEKIKREKAHCYINVPSTHFCRAVLDPFKAVSLLEKKMLLASSYKEEITTVSLYRNILVH